MVISGNPTGRPINIGRLEKELRLKIENYSNTQPLRKLIHEYHQTLTNYISRLSTQRYYHTGKYI
jgi:hypothetical protein